MKNKHSILLFCLLVFSNAFAQQRNPDVDNALTRISLNLLEADYAAAVASYDVLIAKDPINASEYSYEKGICYYRQHLDSLSKDAFRQGLTKKNTYAGNNLGMALCLFSAYPDSSLFYLRKVELALKDSLYYLQNIRSKNYANRRQILADAYQNTALILFQKKQYDSSQNYFNKAMDLNPSVDHHFLATAYFFYKSDYFEKAYSYAKIATELNRYESRSALLMGLSLEQQGKLTKAVNSLKELIVAQEVALSSWRRGDGSIKKDLMSSYQMKGYKHMEEINAEFYVVLSYLYYKKNEKELSAEAYKKAVKLSSEVFYNINTEASYKAFIEDFIAYKLRPPIAPKDYLPVYRNLFSVTGTGSGNGKP